VIGRLGDRSRGQALVEFALVLPIFLLLLFGLIDVGRYVYVSNAFNQAAREAARTGAVEQWKYDCPASVPVAGQNRFTCTMAVAQDRLVGQSIDTGASSVTCVSAALQTQTASQCGATDILIVSLTSGTGANRFRFLTPIIGQILSPPQIVGNAKVEVQ
jgi:Flp pilus assembly protein TadG